MTKSALLVAGIAAVCCCIFISGGCSTLPGALPAKTLRIRVTPGVVDLVPLFNSGADQRSRPLLLFLDPVLFDPGVLVNRTTGPAVWFARRGFRVYVARNLSASGKAFDNDPATIMAMVNLLMKEVHSTPYTEHTGPEKHADESTSETQIFLIATSPGGQPVLQILAAKDDQTRRGFARRIAGVAFLGTGFDYAGKESILSMYPGLPGTDLGDACTPGHPCYPFVRPEVDERGFLLRRFPGLQLHTPEADLTLLEESTVPIALVTGTADIFAPPQSTEQLRKRYGIRAGCTFSEDTHSCAFDLNAGSQRGFSRDYDGFDLVSASDAPGDIYESLEKWILARSRTQ